MVSEENVGALKDVHITDITQMHHCIFTKKLRYHTGTNVTTSQRQTAAEIIIKCNIHNLITVTCFEDQIIQYHNMNDFSLASNDVLSASYQINV